MWPQRSAGSATGSVVIDGDADRAGGYPVTDTEAPSKRATGSDIHQRGSDAKRSLRLSQAVTGDGTIDFLSSSLQYASPELKA